MRLNVNVGGIPTPGPQKPNINGADVVKAAKSSLVFGIISTILALVSVSSRVSFYIVRSFISDVSTALEIWGTIVDPTIFLRYFNLGSILASALMIVVTTILGILGIALYPKTSSGKIAQTTDKVGLMLSIIALVLAAVTLILCFPIVIVV